MAQLLLLVGYLSVLLKAGFVRHDGHEFIAWTGLFLAVPMLASGNRAVRWRCDPLLAPLLICFWYLYGPYMRQSQWGSLLNPAFNAMVRSIANVQAVAEFALHPRIWMASRDLQLKTAEERIRLVAHLPDLRDGSVDIIPSRQSEVIATGMDFRPRPTIQEYTTYSRSLIERNRLFYLSTKAPDYVLFAPGSIDGRHPASAEGALWPLFLQRYVPVERDRDILVLRKRPQPLPDILKEPVIRQARLGERIAVPTSTAPMYIKIDVRYSLLGRIAELLFKPPVISLHALYDGAPTEDYRLIPDIAREGSILVPTIKTSSMFFRLYVGDDAPNKQNRPIAFEVVVRPREAWAYQPNVSFSFAEIDTDVLAKLDNRPSIE
jgi:hypothetical protein